MKAEAEGLVKNYQTRFEDLSRRADAIMQRGNAISASAPDAASAVQMFRVAKAKLETLKAQTKNAPGEIAQIKDTAAMQKYFDDATRGLGEGYTQVNADFDAIESWITLAEAKPQQVTRREPVVPSPGSSPPPAPPPGNPGEMGAGGTTPNAPR